MTHRVDKNMVRDRTKIMINNFNQKISSQVSFFELLENIRSSGAFNIPGIVLFKKKLCHISDIKKF